MRYTLTPIQCRPWTLNGLSLKLIESHYENNYGGALRRLNAISASLDALDLATAPAHVVNGLKRDQLVAHERREECPLAVPRRVPRIREIREQGLPGLRRPAVSLRQAPGRVHQRDRRLRCRVQREREPLDGSDERESSVRADASQGCNSIRRGRAGIHPGVRGDPQHLARAIHHPDTPACGRGGAHDGRDIPGQCGFPCSQPIIHQHDPAGRVPGRHGPITRHGRASVEPQQPPAGRGLPVDGEGRRARARGTGPQHRGQAGQPRHRGEASRAESDPHHDRWIVAISIARAPPAEKALPFTVTRCSANSLSRPF